MKQIVFILFFTMLLTGCGEKPRQQGLDTAAILQAVIDSPEIDQYFHIDSFPHRKPLLITGNNIYNLQLTKFGVPVKILNKNEIKQYDNAAVSGRYPPYYLKIQSIMISKTGKNAVVNIDYPAEGMRGSIELEKRSAWMVNNCKIKEY